MDCPQLKQRDQMTRCIELKDSQSNATFCMRPDVQEYATQRQSVAARPSVILFHGRLDKGASSKHKREMLNRDVQFYEKRNHEDIIERSPVSSEDIDDDYEVQQKAVSPGLSGYEANAEECGCIRKRHRTSFNSFQLKRLEEEFDGDNYIIGMKRWRLSEELEIPEKQIKIWFQNRRTKSKKHCNSNACRHTSKEHDREHTI